MSLVSLLKHTKTKMLFTFFLTVWLKKVNIAVTWGKKYFKKELLMTKEDNEDFMNSTKCWICDNDYVDNDVKVRDQCHIPRKCRSSAHGDCNSNLKLNHKIPFVLHNL